MKNYKFKKEQEKDLVFSYTQQLQNKENIRNGFYVYSEENKRKRKRNEIVSSWA